MTPIRRSPLPGELFSPQVTETAYFFLNLTPGSRVSCVLSTGGREHCNPDYVVRRRKYGYTVLECVVEGMGHVVLDGRRYLLRPGSVFTYRQDTACEIHTDPVHRLVKYFICLSGRKAPQRLAQAGIRPATAIQLPTHLEIQSLFALLVHEGQARTRFSAQTCELLFQLILWKVQTGLTHRAPRTPVGYERFTRLKQLIDSEAARLGSLRESARRAGLSPVLACKLFNQHLGLSPFRYLMRRKMEIAAELLVQGEVLVKEAAAHVGFKDPYHFSRRFKQAYRVAPATMRSRRGVDTSGG